MFCYCCYRFFSLFSVLFLVLSTVVGELKHMISISLLAGWCNGHSFLDLAGSISDHSAVM